MSHVLPDGFMSHFAQEEYRFRLLSPGLLSYTFWRVQEKALF